MYIVNDSEALEESDNEDDIYTSSQVEGFSGFDETVYQTVVAPIFNFE